jgi:hypothetical protein
VQTLAAIRAQTKGKICLWEKLLKALTATAENSFFPAIHAQEMTF